MKNPTPIKTTPRSRREKCSLMSNRVKKDPDYIRTRENGQNFGHAAKCGKLLRYAFCELLSTTDASAVARLHQRMMQCLQSDNKSSRGSRQVSKGDLSVLEGFQFLADNTLSKVLCIVPQLLVDRSAGAVTLQLPAFIPALVINHPKSASHYRLRFAAAELDFDHAEYKTDHTKTGLLPLNDQPTTPLTLSLAITPNTTLPIIQLFAIEFYDSTGSTPQPIHSAHSNSISILAVNTVNEEE